MKVHCAAVKYLLHLIILDDHRHEPPNPHAPPDDPVAEAAKKPEETAAKGEDAKKEEAKKEEGKKEEGKKEEGEKKKEGEAEKKEPEKETNKVRH